MDAFKPKEYENEKVEPKSSANQDEEKVRVRRAIEDHDAKRDGKDDEDLW